MTTGFCVKCKRKIEIKAGQTVSMKRGMKALKGKCSKCGTTVFRILGKA